ncbi:MAG: efflux RND transporter periplasmic adaptor subunit [Parachlamydiaceae bacterium]|nr:efflux RND transporter periplasmic adaptor subunit [Parachlamydiaceae bacterium]
MKRISSLLLTGFINLAMYGDSSMKRITSLLLTGLVLTACEPPQETPKIEIPAVPVLVTTPAVKDIPLYVEALGTLTASVSAGICPQVNGLLTEVLVDEGSWVKPGTPLIKIDARPYAIKQQEAEAQLAIDRKTHESLVKKMERFKGLAQKDLLAQTEWDDLETEVAKSRALIDLSQARLNAAKLDLERCTIVSPIEGRVGKLSATEGALVTAGASNSLVTVVDLDPLYVDFYLTEREFASMPKSNLEISVKPLHGDKEVKGQLTFLDNQFDSKTGLLLVRGTIANPEYTLRPGQNVKVKVPVSVVANAKQIPQKAVKYNQEGPYIYVVQADQTVISRPVLLGVEQGDQVMILEGLDAGEMVITEGHLRLAPGTKVEVK